MVISALLWVGCESKHTPSLPKAIPTTPVSPEAFDALVDSRGSATFNSYQGVWKGYGTDMQIIFLPAGRLYIIKYGLAARGYSGTYSIKGQDIYIHTVKDPPLVPDGPLQLRKEGGHFLLFIKGTEDEYGTIKLPPGRSIWPLGLLSAETEPASRHNMQSMQAAEKRRDDALNEKH
jgi:hypothetical protein